jgi:hypothetical protein
MYSDLNGLSTELQYIYLSSLEDTAIINLSCKEYPSFNKQFILPPHTDVYYDLYTDVDAVLSTSEVVSGKVIRVRSSSAIICIGDNGSSNFRDNFVAVSEDKAGTEFRVLTYKHYYYDENSVVRLVPQLAVAAFYSGTQVKITPTEKTFNGSPKDSTLTFMLDSGECIFLQSEWVKGNLRDLSGSKITSNFPVAVFSGHPGANVPYDISFSGEQFLTESMPPISTLGKGYVFQLSIPRTISDTNLIDFYPGSELVRALAVKNNTQLSLNGKPWGLPLQEGQYLDSLLNGTVLVTANEPILVGDYSHSEYWGGDSSAGAAFLATLPSLESRCTDQTFYVRPDTFLDCLVFTAQYVQVVVERSNKANVQMDGILIPDTLFTDVPGTFEGKEFSVGSIKTSPGKQHRLQVPGKNENGFVFMVYGSSTGVVDLFGAQTAYAYGSQMLYRTTGPLGVSPSAHIESIELIAYPNPAKGYVSLEVHSLGKQNATVEIFDALGNRRCHFTSALTEGSNIVTVSLSECSAGTYTARITAGAKTFSARFVVSD